MAKPKPVLVIATMHHQADCAIACLATILRVPYEEILVAASQRIPTVLVSGLHNEDMIAIAESFGQTLVERTGTEIDYRTSIGILGAHLSYHQPGEEHAVVLSSGLIFDPMGKGEIWRVKDWIKKFNATDIDLLELE